MLGETKLGDSVAVNGVCLTVTALSTDSFSADVMPETLRRTNLGKLRAGDEVAQKLVFVLISVLVQDRVY